MDEHTLALLEFPRIIDELAALCVSPEGAAALRGQPLVTEPAPLADSLALALEFRAILESGDSLPGFDFPDLGGVLLMLGKPGMQLEGEELAAIGRWVLSGLKLKRVVLKAGTGRLGAIASEIPDLAPLSRRIFHIVDPEGVMKEKQIPELAAIRERIRRHRADADRSVRGLLEDHDYHSYWQTTTPTQRDGRVVLPLKSQYKGRVKGIVHEMSASGSTLFIEPLEVVETNNAIVQEENLYRVEVRRILRELTAEVSARAGELRLLVEKAAFLDTFLARARYAVQHSCRRADTSEGRPGSPGCIDLRDARHPLLGPRVVPVSVSAGADNHRPEYGRQDRQPQDGRAPRAHESIRNGSPGRGRLDAAAFRRDLRGYRGRAVDRAVPLHVLRAHRKSLPDREPRHIPLPRAAGRAGSGD